VSTGPLSGALRVSSLLLLCMARSHRLNLGSMSPVGAAEGCDLLILFFGSKSKDRSLRQLLQVCFN
jgi:hypothetical protein